MTITVRIEFGGDEHPNGEMKPIVLTDAARMRARIKFNPSGDERVTRLKALAAAFYTELHDLMDGQPDERTQAFYEALEASGYIQAGAMFAVSAATAHLA